MGEPVSIEILCWYGKLKKRNFVLGLLICEKAADISLVGELRVSELQECRDKGIRHPENDE